VTLTVNLQDTGIVLAVHDEGAGIAPEDQARIFEPEFSTKKEGMGLGLAIVEGIVAGHGGTIEVRSEPGAGTTFTLRLPAGGPEPATAEETS
jgi:signal transduction histidine kinase